MPNYLGNWRSRSVTVRFSCARNNVFEHKINFCVDVHMACFSCVWMWFICMCVIQITHVIVHIVKLKWFQISTYWTHCSINLLGKSGVELFIHSQASTVAPLKFGNRYVISSYFLHCHSFVTSLWQCYEFVNTFDDLMTTLQQLAVWR